MEEEPAKKTRHHSIKQLKGIAPKPNTVISLDEMNIAIELEGAKIGSGPELRIFM